MVNVSYFIVLESVVSIAGVLICVGLFLSYSRARRALRWWERRRGFQLYCETERIRNG